MRKPRRPHRGGSAKPKTMPPAAATIFPAIEVWKDVSKKLQLFQKIRKTRSETRLQNSREFVAFLETSLPLLRA
jgi:hypothetical protein